jgi:hypothetical protein
MGFINASVEAALFASQPENPWKPLKVPKTAYRPTLSSAISA